MQVDVQRRRIGLTMRLEDEAKDQGMDIKRDKPTKGQSRKQNNGSGNPKAGRNNGSNNGGGRPVNSAMADALAKARKK
jgi:uncharacterized protein